MWRLRIFELNLNVVHWDGINNQTANVLSRMATDGVDKSPIGHDIPVGVISTTSNHNNRIMFEIVRCRALDIVVENSYKF